MSLQGPLPLFRSSLCAVELVAQTVKSLPATQEILQVRSLGGEDPLEKGEMGKTV